MIWLVFAVLTGLAALGVLWPLSRRGADVAADDADFYAGAVAAIDSDVKRGIVSEADARAMKAEAARRFIASEDADRGETRSPWRRRIAALASIAIVGGVGLGLYARLGNPGVPDLPLEARRNAPPDQPDIMMAVLKIEKHLAQNPDDGQGWEVIAPVYLRLAHYNDAVKAWANAIRVLGATATRETALGEAMVFAAGGKVTPPAVAAFERAVERAPRYPQARFYLGLAAQQDGEIEKARTIWTQLLGEAPADAEWATVVRERLDELGPSPDEKVASEQGQAIAALPQTERDATIRTMVSSLAERLKDNGSDANGWAMLIRAYSVLKEPERAREALADARKALGDDAEAKARLDALARELKIEG